MHEPVFSCFLAFVFLVELFLEIIEFVVQHFRRLVGLGHRCQEGQGWHEDNENQEKSVHRIQRHHSKDYDEQTRAHRITDQGARVATSFKLCLIYADSWS